MSVFDADEYVELRKNRIKAIVDNFGVEWFKDKKVLELGCGHAEIGNAFYELGANVTSTDARAEHLEVVNERYPQLHTVLCNLNDDWPFDNDYDFIINTGILYHLENYETFLKHCFQSCENMFLESIVTDFKNPNYVIYSSEGGEDQAFLGIGCHPSEANIEKIIKENHFTFKRCFKSELNAGIHLFDWKRENSILCYKYINEKFHWLRRAWFCSNESP
jgi:cyclopropane fatty-acyl-phospholipid synthase-like methyltransferase